MSRLASDPAAGAAVEGSAGENLAAIETPAVRGLAVEGSRVQNPAVEGLVTEFRYPYVHRTHERWPAVL